MRLMRYIYDVVSRMHQSLGDQKTCRKLPILPRRPHDHGDALAFNPYFQRFLGGQIIKIL